VQVAGAIWAVAFVGTLAFPRLVGLLMPIWMIGGLFAGGSLMITGLYKAESRHGDWSAIVDRPNPLKRLIVREEIR
jgi:hypothetical protein